MNENPYQIVRDDIIDRNQYSPDFYLENSFKWGNLLEKLNNTVLNNIEDIRDSIEKNPTAYKKRFISKQFKDAIEEKNENKIPENKAKCKQTKSEFIEKLFKISENEWAKDFHPKTKDFLAVYCGYSGWKDLISDFDLSLKDKKETGVLNVKVDGSSIIEKNINQTLENIEKINDSIENNYNEIVSINYRYNEIIDLLHIGKQKSYENLNQLKKSEYLSVLVYKIKSEALLKPSTCLELETFTSFEGGKKWTWYERCFIINFLISSLFNNFDRKKIKYLIALVKFGENSTWYRALIGIILYTIKIFNNKERSTFLKDNILIEFQNYPEIKYAIVNTLSLILKKDLFDKKLFSNKFFQIKDKATDLRFTPFFKDHPLIKEERENHNMNVDYESFINLLIDSPNMSDFARYRSVLQLSKISNLAENDIYKLLSDLKKKRLESYKLNPQIHDYEIIKGTLTDIFYSLELEEKKLDILHPANNNYLIHFDEIISLSPQICIYIGDNFKTKKNYKNALKYYKKALNNEYENNSKTIELIELCYTYLGNHINEKLIKEVEITEADFEVLKELSTFFHATKKYDKALKYLNMALSVKHQDIQLLIQVINCYQEIGDSNEAHVYAKKAFGIEPENVDVLLCIGETYLYKSNYKEAKKKFEKILKIDDQNIQALEVLGTMYFKSQDYKNTIKYLDKLKSIDQTRINSLKLLGQSYLMTDEINNAIECFVIIADNVPDDDLILLDLANCYSSIKEWNNAKKCFIRLLRLDDENSYIYLSLGQIELILKNYSEALNYFKKSKELHKNVEDFDRTLIKDLNNLKIHGVSENEIKELLSKIQKLSNNL